MDDLISRAAAIDYLMTNMDLHYDDGYEVDDADVKRAIISDLVNGIPVVDAIPVEWLKAHRTEYFEDWGDVPVTIDGALIMWQKEQEAR